MFPIIQPLRLQETPETEYRKEQRLFAKMQTDFHERRAQELRGAAIRRWAARARLPRWRPWARRA